MGAKWDPKKRLWYYFDDAIADPTVFLKWARDNDEIPDDVSMEDFAVNTNNLFYFLVNDVMDLFRGLTKSDLHNTNLGIILQRMDIEKVGYTLNGATAYGSVTKGQWKEIWRSLLKAARKKDAKIIYDGLPGIPYSYEPLFKIKPYREFNLDKDLV